MNLPARALRLSAAAALVSEPVTVELYMEAHHGGVITTHNVVGEWRGSERPDEVCVQTL